MKLLSLLLLTASPAAAAVIMQVPGGYYRSASDSPFFPQLQAGTAFLNDFSQDEDGYYWVNSAGQTVWHEYSNAQYATSQTLRWEFARRVFTVALGPGAENVSVDADDGKHDGWSDGGWGLGGDGLSSTPTSDIYFTTTNGATNYPLWVGFVMTTNGVGDFFPDPPIVDLLGVGGNLLGSFSLLDVRNEMYQQSTNGQPAQFQRVFNDRAVFFHSDEPITRLKIRNMVAIDHLQWGYSTVYVPEPGAVALLLAAGAALFRRRRT
jgi:hypothetical protein